MAEGLSPRVRGNPSSSGVAGTMMGSIPACAGKPTSIGCTRPFGRVYPRVCGETMLEAMRKQYADGLSPRVRGNQA